VEILTEFSKYSSKQNYILNLSNLNIFELFDGSNITIKLLSTGSSYDSGIKLNVI
jgi:hypothetical protein